MKRVLLVLVLVLFATAAPAQISYPPPSNTVYSSAWNGVTNIAPTKNAIYDYLHLFDTDDDGLVNVLELADAASDTTTFPLLGSAATGSSGPLTDAGLAYNASTDALTLAGALTAGTVTDPAENGVIRLDNADLICWESSAASANEPCISMDASEQLLLGSNVTALVLNPVAGAAPTASGAVAYDSTANALEYGDNGTNRTVANLDEAQTFATGAKTFTAYIDAGDGTLQIPNGTAVSLSNAGDIAVDTSDADADQLVIDDGTNEYVFVAEQTKCITIPVLAATDDDVPLHGFLDASTITAVACTVRGTTPTATVVFTDGTNTVKSVTCGTTATTLTWDRASLTNTTYTANEVIELDTTSVTGTITYAQACFAFKTDRQ